MKADFEKYAPDPSMYYAFTKDFMRVDIGLMIQRPPIFMYMRKNDFDHLNNRQKIMEEYYCDTKQYIDEFNEVAKLNEDCLANNPYASRMNIDNYPTHRKFKGMVTRTVTDENGDEYEVEEEDYETYCAASKQFSLVDPKCSDRHSLHYAGEDRVYLIFKNKYTNEWEFPVGRLYLNQSMFRGKMELFN